MSRGAVTGIKCVLKRFPFILLIPVTYCSIVVTPGFAKPSPLLKPVAISMGDGYLSGEAGRWQGNSDAETGDFFGTDRAANWVGYFSGYSYSPERIYSGTFHSPDIKNTNDGITNGLGCHRSDAPPILKAESKELATGNIACSGATTADVNYSGNYFGRYNLTFKGEKNQREQLREIADEKNVKLIVLSIGGGDLGYSKIIKSCTTLWNDRDSLDDLQTCKALNSDKLQNIDEVMKGVGTAIESIQETMKGLGYKPREDYRLILQSIPSPVPPASRARVAEADRSLSGCPLRDVDMTWVHDVLTPLISEKLSKVASSRKVDFLDLTAALTGHEVCVNDAFQAGKEKSSDLRSSMEWARFVAFPWPNIPTVLYDQGVEAELMYPNYYGQESIGSCIAAMRLHSDSILKRQQRVVGKCTVDPGTGQSLAMMRDFPV